MPKPNTFTGNPGAIPAELTTMPLWAVWRWTPRESNPSKFSKPPFQSQQPHIPASTLKPEHWSTFAAARSVVDAKQADGVSFNLFNSGYGALDLDHCRDEVGNIDDWAQSLLDQAERCGAYIEITPSGAGLRVIGRATGKDTNRKFAIPGSANGAAVEIFRNTAKPITVTGAKSPHLQVAPELPNIDRLLDDTVALYERLKTEQPQNTERTTNNYCHDEYEDFVRDGAPDGKDRSAVFHACVWHFAAIGLNIDEIVDKFVACPEGIAARYISEGRLQGEVERSFKAWQAANPKPFRKRRGSQGSAPSPDDTLEITRASDIAPQAIEWFWPDHYALGKLGVIGGLPDRGKGLVAAYLIGRATTGESWPSDEGQAPLGNVVLLTAEDTLNDTVIPRLLAAGADMERVKIVRMVRAKDGSKRMFSLLTDLPALERAMHEIGDVVLIVIDPMSAYFGVGKLDSYRTSDVRGVLTPLQTLAERYHCSIIGVMHFNKNSKTRSAMLRLSDSLAFVAAPRHAFVVIDQPDTEQRLFAKAKNNLTRAKVSTLAYGVQVKLVGVDCDTNAEIRAPYVVWEGEVAMTAEEALEGASDQSGEERAQAKVDVARAWIAEFVENEWRFSHEIYAAGMQAGHSQRTLERAMRTLPLDRRREEGRNGRSQWKLAK
jgi:hypothetical protein